MNFKVNECKCVLKVELYLWKKRVPGLSIFSNKLHLQYSILTIIDQFIKDKDRSRQKERKQMDFELLI